MNLYDQVTHYVKTGQDLYQNKRVSWFVEPRTYDMPRFYEQIKKVLKENKKDDSYMDMTLQELQDIITCVASIFIRADYSMNFKYTDLSKFQNYIGF